MDINSLIESLGFPISCVLALGWYINKKIKMKRKSDLEKEKMINKIKKDYFKRLHISGM